MKFEEAMKFLREGRKIKRESTCPIWISKDDSFLYYGTDKINSFWIPTMTDLLSEDWEVVENKVEITREQLFSALQEIPWMGRGFNDMAKLFDRVADKLGL